MKTISVSILTLLFASQAFGASIYKKSLDKKLDQYLSDGVFVGGRSGDGFSLLNVRRQYAKKSKTERIVLDMGDRHGKPLLKRVSFYHVNVQSNPPRLVIDLAQVSKSGVSEKHLAEIFSKSPFIKSTALTMDPEDRGATMVLNLKETMAAEVFAMPAKNKPSRIVIDIKPKNLTMKAKKG